MVTTIRKYTGGAHPFLEFACLSTDTKPVALVPDNSLCHEIDTGKRYYFANKAWHEAPARGGSGDGEGGSSLPANFPTEGAENANKFAGFDENGLWTAKDAPSGGGAEKFIFTLTETDGTWTANKTVDEIVEAKDAGQEVEAHIVLDMEPQLTVIAQPAVIESFQDECAVVLFYAVFEQEQGSPKLFTVMCTNADGERCFVTQTPLGNATNEPLIVTMTADESTGKYVGDKTFAEVFAAMTAGKPVTCVVPNTGAIRIIDATQIDVEGEAVVLLTHSVLGSEGTASLNVISGSPNEHPYVTLS